jgi:hypothetical protein
VLFKPSPEPDGHAVHSDLDRIVAVTAKSVEAMAEKNGVFGVALLRDGQRFQRSISVRDLPAPYVLGGPWKLVLEGTGFPRLEKTLAHLASWTDDASTRHFSGTGRYSLSFDLPPAYVADDVQLRLDLGTVGNVAEVALNGANVGTQWLRGQMLEITGSVRPGANRLVVLVTNTLINRVSGFKGPPPVPESLVPLVGRGIASAGSRIPIGFQPLPAAGLLGPVKVVPVARVRVPLE